MPVNGNSAASYFVQRSVFAAANPSTYGNEAAARTSPANGMAGTSRDKDSLGRTFFVCDRAVVDGDCVVE
jgi:hypothetical protein